MIGNFIAINSDDWDRLTNNPKEIEAFLYPEMADYESIGEKYIDIDKAWNVIHFILTGSADEGNEPNRNVILGGEELGEDVGYGPARFVGKDKVKQINELLSTLTDDIIEAKFDINLFREIKIYPNFWDDPSDDDVEYFKGYFNDLKDFYTFAADNNLHVIQYIN